MMSSKNSSKVSKYMANGEKCCIICRKNLKEFLGPTTGGIELPCNFLDTLNLVWPSLEENKERKQNEGVEIGDKKFCEDGGAALLGGGDHKGGRFTKVPPICQVCADRIESVQYFKGLSERYLDKLKKSMEEAKSVANGYRPSSSFSSKSKENEILKKSVKTPQSPDIPATLNLPWKPKILQKASTPFSSSSHDQFISMETQHIERTTRAILNKITNNGPTFDVLSAQLVAALSFLKNIQKYPSRDNQLIMNSVASLILNKAVNEPLYSPAYIKLFKEICKISDEVGKTIRKIVLDTCQSHFLQLCANTESSSEASEGENKDKRGRCLKIVNFIQELYNFKLLTTRILIQCLEILLVPPVNQLRLECIYNFLAAEKQHANSNQLFAQIIDVQLKALMDSKKDGKNGKYLPQDGCMDKVFNKLSEFSKDHRFSGRIRYLLENLLELRANGWKKQDESCSTAKENGELPGGKTVLKPTPPNEEPALTLWLFERNTRGILNKLNLSDGKLFDKNFSRFLKLPFWFCGEYSNNDKQILMAGEMIFEKAVNEPMYCSAYAAMLQKIGQFRRKYPYSINFEKMREIVVNRCIEEIGKISENAHADHKEAEEFGERERILSVIKFIGELYKLEEFSARNMGTCVKLLINDCGEVSELMVECVYKLLMCKFMNGETKEMVYYGEFLDVQLSVLNAAEMEDDDDVRWIEGMFENLKKFVGDLRFGRRVRCLLINLLELKGNGWKHESKAVATMAFLKDDKGKKNGGNGGNKKGRRGGGGVVPDGNWRSKRCAANF